ncbi:MAG: hypothetical protein IIU87_03690 [Prevotella sp.]|nr:hypothetical protein [Prevotella sp.]
MAVRLQRDGVTMAFLSHHDKNVIALRWLCNGSATTTPSYRRHKAMMT